MTSSLNRRGFMAAAGAALAAGRARSAERVLNAGVIGCGWYGMVDMKAALKAGSTRAAAICDVDEEHLKNSADELETLQGSRPKVFKHYQELLETPDLDCIIIATPPQWHALQFIACCEKGLPVYCEKPLSYDIREGRAMSAAAKAAGNIVQIGFQRRKSRAFQAAKEFIGSGKAGRIVQVDAQIHYTAGMKDATPQEPPESLDWDLWCGPAPKLPYSPNIGHFQWRLEKEYGHGHLVDWGIHLIDAARMVLDLEEPGRVTAAGGLYQLAGQITTPDTLTVHFEFERCPVVWRHRLWGSAEYAPETNNGIFFYGDKATVFASDRRWVVIPKDTGQERLEFEENADMGGDHMAEFLAAVRENRQPSCRPEDGYRSTATVQLGMIAFESGANISWDAAKGALQGPPEAQALVKREYRAPWTHPHKG